MKRPSLLNIHSFSGLRHRGQVKMYEVWDSFHLSPVLSRYSRSFLPSPSGVVFGGIDLGVFGIVGAHLAGEVACPQLTEDFPLQLFVVLEGGEEGGLALPLLAVEDVVG